MGGSAPMPTIGRSPTLARFLFKTDVTAAEMVPPTPDASPRECLALGLLKERTGRFVLAPDRLAPNVLRDVLHACGPTPFRSLRRQAVHRAIYNIVFSPAAHCAVEGLARRASPIRGARKTCRMANHLAWRKCGWPCSGAGDLAGSEHSRGDTSASHSSFVPVIGSPHRRAIFCFWPGLSGRLRAVRWAAAGARPARPADLLLVCTPTIFAWRRSDG